MGGSTTLPTAEATDVSTKPRQRRRGDFYFWQFLILRVPMAVYAIVLFVYLGRYIHKWQGALRQPEDAEYSNPTRKDALEQSGLALSMVRRRKTPSLRISHPLYFEVPQRIRLTW